jgi:hypothetical protein
VVAKIDALTDAAAEDAHKAEVQRGILAQHAGGLVGTSSPWLKATHEFQDWATRHAAVQGEHPRKERLLKATADCDPKTDSCHTSSGDAHIKFIPQSNMLFCICPKCGSTSLYQYMFGAIMGTPWAEFKAQQPWAQLAQHRAQDQSEETEAPYWHGYIQGGGSEGYPASMWHDPSIYTHAIVRDPIDRLISAWVNKLSCGLYSVPAGADGSFNASVKDQALWHSVVESGVTAAYAETVAAAAQRPDLVQKRRYAAPCSGWAYGEGRLETPCVPGRSDGAEGSGSFSERSCTSLDLEDFADALVGIYKQWDFDSASWHEDKGHLKRLNGHFRPQIGPYSCFGAVAPQDYDAVSTIGDREAMRQFSRHLPSHKLGLFGEDDSGTPSNMHENLYYEGKPWAPSAAAIQKLMEATQREREVLHGFYTPEHKYYSGEDGEQKNSDPAHGPCEEFCADDPAAWADKCYWESCNGCDERCDELREAARQRESS